jgi:hypothetical protein
MGMIVLAYNPSDSGDKGRKVMNLRPAWAKLLGPYLKKNKTKQMKGPEAWPNKHRLWAQSLALPKTSCVEILSPV